MSSWLKAWILPGAVFQTIIVGGGYGTGREVVEFISRFGPAGGIAAAVVIGLLMGLVLGLTFDLALKYQIRDYRSFFKMLLGRFWATYEVVFVISLVLVLAVTGSAAGLVLHDSLGVPVFIGIAIMILVIVVLNYLGRQWVEKTLAVWGLLMSLVLICYAVTTFMGRGDAIATSFAASEIQPRWWVSGVQFFLYNIFVAPAALYATDHIYTRRQAWGAGFVAGFLGVLPAFVFHLTFMAEYPAILEQPLPTYWMLQQLGISALLIVYVVLLFGTIVQTGVGVLQGINERLDYWWRERTGHALSPRVHSSVAGLTVILSLLAANIGIVALVAKGYGSLAWFSLGIFVVPVLTLGVRKLRAEPT